VTAGVEGLPTDARDRLAQALIDAKLIRWREPELAREYADALLLVVAELCDEARADELRAAAREDKVSTKLWCDSSVAPQRVVKISNLYARADALTTDRQPTCQAPHAEGAVTWRCLQPAGHGDQHEDSAGHKW